MDNSGGGAWYKPILKIAVIWWIVVASLAWVGRWIEQNAHYIWVVVAVTVLGFVIFAVLAYAVYTFRRFRSW